MMTAKKWVIAALAAPIIALAALTAWKHVRMSTGTELVLPIRGYDPRDLLSGHYLIYQVDYGIADVCRGRQRNPPEKWLCLDSKSVSNYHPVGCEVVIKGRCDGSRFRAGIERFYIPENESRQLERLVQSRQASIRVSVSADGTARIKDLLIDGVTWKELLLETPPAQ